MSLSESIVERFITANGCQLGGLALVCPQFEITRSRGETWHASFDFLIVYRDKGSDKWIIIIAEVSDGGGLGSVRSKAELFKEPNYHSRLEEAVIDRTFGLVSDLDLRFLGFVRTQALVAEAEKLFPDRERFAFRSIEEASVEGWWEKREKGLWPAGLLVPASP